MVKVLAHVGSPGDGHAFLSWQDEGHALDASMEDQKGTRSRLHDHVEGRESNPMMLVMMVANKKHLRSAINE